MKKKLMLKKLLMILNTISTKDALAAYQKFLTQNLDHYEYFDDAIEDWVNGSTGRMSSANLVLPWVIFIRDRLRFEKEFSQLKIQNIKYHTFLSYIVTGGMTYRSFLPGFFAPLVDLVEWLVSPWMKTLGTGMTIDIIKAPKVLNK